MNDIEHIPVKPNINNSAIRVKKNTNVLDNIKDSKDPEVQQILNKKNDVFNIEAMKTKEEQTQEVVTHDTSSSWLIVILAIIIVILIVVIIYYVLKYNAVSTVATIPANIVKPIKHDGYLHNYTQKVNPQPEIRMENIQKMERIEHVEKPKNFVEPTKKDLDDIINRLNPDNNKSDNKSDNNSENENTPVITEIQDDNSDVESSDNHISIDKKIEELIMSDDNLDNEIIDDDIEDQFKKNILNNE